MPDPATVISLRAARDGARRRFDEDLEQIKSDMSARSLGERIAGKLQDDAQAAGTYALDVIEDNKAVVGGTVAALGIWFFRKPITAWIETHFGDEQSPENAESEFKDTSDE